MMILLVNLRKAVKGYTSICGFGNYVRIFLLLLLILALITCKEFNPEQKQQEIQQSEFASKQYKLALKQAEESNANGLLKLYEIASDDMSYTVEYSEAARENLIYFLVSKTDFWIRTFSKVELNNFKTYLNKTGLKVSKLPKGITSDKQFEQIMVNNLQNIKGNKKECELIDYILELIKKEYLVKS